MTTISLKDSPEEQKEETKTEKLSNKIAEHNIESLSNDFIKNGFVEVPDFLEHTFASKCHYFYTKEMPEDWFRLTSSPSLNGEDEFALEFTPDYSEEQKSHTLSYFNQNKFSYRFHRTFDNHYENCGCFECDIRSFFKSEEILSFLSGITQQDISKPSTQFSSWYKKGDFLSAHHDKDNGKVGVVLDFAMNWSPVFGGNLYLLEDNWIDVKKVIVPKFNNLKVFNIPEDRDGVPHFVSTVVADDLPDRKRVAFGGWYN